MMTHYINGSNENTVVQTIQIPLEFIHSFFFLVFLIRTCEHTQHSSEPLMWIQGLLLCPLTSHIKPLSLDMLPIYIYIVRLESD